MEAQTWKKPQIMDEDIVISGMSGRFPESDSTDEFAQNLYNGVDMLTSDTRRWPTDLYGMSQNMGKIKEVDKFDGLFFGIMNAMGDTIDPQSRILLETTYEAIVDAGVNPQTLRGSDTGVYIGFSTFGMPDGVPEETQPDSQNSMAEILLWVPGNSKCLYANRVSFVLDFKGPSLVIDTACSSSMVAFNVAMNDLRLGKCRQAIVGGTNIDLQPFTNHIFQSTKLNSRDGLPKVWDESADGFARGECVSCLFLQRKSDSKRIYATVLNSGVNIDGNKRMGMFFPCPDSQEELMIRTYKEIGVNPLDINYFEAHATGTKVGDPQEAKAIYNAYCGKPKRKGTLPIGLLKSNIGHAEGASGVSSIVKVLLAYENECIPPNLHLKNLKSSIRDFCPPLVPIQENFKYTPGIAGVNNFGVGGVNAHALLAPNNKLNDDENLKIAEDIPRIINLCCRTQESLNKMFDFIENNPQKITRDFLALLGGTMKTRPLLNSCGLPYRGSMIIKKVVGEDGQSQYEYKKQSSVLTVKTQRPVWFLFPGLGGQWTGMAKGLMPIKRFADKIEECHKVLEPFGVDLKYLLLSDDPNSMSTMTNKFCATTAIELALFDLITSLGIVPDGIIGHSFGEIACAYADGCLTTEEALLVTYIRGIVTESDKKIPRGLMAVVGMSWNEAKKICPKGVSVVCNNAKDTVVLSGLYNEMKKVVEELTKKGVFVRELQSSDIPYHSEYLVTSAKRMTEEIKKYLPNPKLRSKKWLSTAILDSDVDNSLKYASAEYFVLNLISPVYFYNKVKHLQTDAIIIEIGPHALFSKIITQTLESSTYLSLIKKDANETNLEMFLTSMAKLYELGVNPDIENLYPKVQWPVARGTQSISSLIQWDHSTSYFVRKYPDYFFRATASDMNEIINLSRSIKSHLPDHSIDGNMLFPATGYLMLAWRQLAAYHGKIWNQIPVVFEDVQFRRPVFLSETEVTRLKVRYFQNSGEFVILENSNPTCTGKVRMPEEYNLSMQSVVMEENVKAEYDVVIKGKDIYHDLHILGYDYGPKFQGLQTIKTNDFETLKGEVLWDGNWVTLMDSLLQTMAAAMPFRKMMVPVMIKQLRCDPKVLYEAVMANKITEEKSMDDIDEEVLDEVIDQERHDLTAGNTTDVGEILESQKIDNIEELIGESFHIYKSILPYHVDMNSRMIVAPGVEVEDLMALPIPRKINAQGLKLESFQFMAHDENEAIEENDKKQIKEYLKVCSLLAAKARYALGTDEKPADNPLDEDLVQQYLTEAKEDHVLMKLINEVVKQVTDENQNTTKTMREEAVTQFIAETQKKPEFDLSLDVINQVSKNERLIRSFVDIVSENNVPKKEIKVLEINLTNGLLVEEVDNQLATSHIYPIDVNYTIAVKNPETLGDNYKNKSFKLSEWDCKKSNFPSDVSMPNLLVHNDSTDLWELKLDTFVQEMHDVLMTNGFLLSVFRNKFTEPELALNAMNGKKDVSNADLEKRVKDFMSAAQKVGFSMIGTKTDSIGSMAVLYRKVVTKEPETPNKKFVINMDATKTHEWFDSIKQILIEKKEDEKNDENLWLVATDSSINGLVGLVNCLRLEPGGDCIRCVLDQDKQLKTPFNWKEAPLRDILVNDLAINVIRDGKMGTLRHLTLTKDYDKVQSSDYFLNIGQNRDLSSLQWYDSKNLFRKDVYYDINNRKVEQIRCNIYSSGLNFRDVMLATGRIVSGPQSLFTDCLLGFEFAGRRTDNGKRICGFDLSRCFATFVDAPEDYITPIPENWSMDDAVTILSTYSTVWYGLIERAQLQKYESILIHSGAGGVGQAAITVCQHYKCDIFVTVGTEDKKKFLMNEYNIPENRIFSSRDIQFKFKIKELTKGKGVDLVLNSLAGDKLEASYECVADCGRFVEIGKYDLQMNKQLGMFSFLRDISFIGVSVDRKLFLVPGFAKRFFQWMHDNSNNGMIRPINRTIFRAPDAEKAFRYMTTGKHIGKIVIKLREEESLEIAINGYNPSQKLTATTKTYFDSRKTYIITGGLGGFGLELVHWMLFQGARKFVLTSRQGIKNDYQKFILDRIESLGNKFEMFRSKVLVSTKDATTTEGCKALLEEANELGPVGGVFHLSLVLNDSLYENQTYEKFCETVNSKTKAFENLDKLSRESKMDMDYFVVFSSVSCGKGNGGQSNYGYGNSVCERICENRRKDGMHGLAIQWGPIGDVGVLAQTEVNSTLSGIVKQRINSCLEILDKFLQSKHSVVSCVVRAERSTIGGTREAKIVNQIWLALGIDPKTTPDHLTLGEIGMESMFAVELQQGLERDYDIKVSLNDIKAITVKLMKDFEAGKVEELRKYADEVKNCRNKLSKIKFIIPTDAITRLNSVKTGNPVYFMPPLEGIFASLEALAEKIDRPVIGLNWTKNMEKLTSLKDITKYYTDLLKEIHPKGDYDIVGHFYGALIAMQMLKKRAPIGKAVIIDMMSDVRMDEDMLSDDFLLDLIGRFISKDLPKPVKEKIQRDMNSKHDVQGKLSKLSDEVKDFVGKSLVSRDLEEILMNSFIRAKLFTQYRLKMKDKYTTAKMSIGKKFLEMTGKVLIIKPIEFGDDIGDFGDISDKIRNSYFLPEQGLEGKLNFEKVDAGGDDMSLQTFDRIAGSINEYLNKK